MLSAVVISGKGVKQKKNTAVENTHVMWFIFLFQFKTMASVLTFGFQTMQA